jgi:hypothetical protein
MKTKLLSLLIVSSIVLAGCNSQPLPASTATNSPTPENTKQASQTPTTTSISTSSSVQNLPDTLTIEGDKVIFDQWGFSLELPLNTWAYNPAMHSRTDDFEGFTFSRKVKLIDKSGNGYSPSVGILFYSVPEGTDLILFSVSLRTQNHTSFPKIESMFGDEGSEPVMKIPALGYYGHLGEGNDYSVFIVHAVNGTVGIQVSFEIVDSVLDQAKPEFFSIMESMSFEGLSKSAVDPTQTPSPSEETFQSMQSATFISDALLHGGLVFSRGSDGHGHGLDADGRIYTCSGLAYNLVNFQGFSDIVIHNESEIDTSSFNRGDVVIFTDPKIPGITAHAAMVTKLEGGMIYITGQYGPKKDGTYITSGYQDKPVTDFLGSIYQTMHIYHYGG